MKIERNKLISFYLYLLGFPYSQKPIGLLKSMEVPTRNWEVIYIDFIGPLPVSGKNKFDTILTVVDRLPKMFHLIPPLDWFLKKWSSTTEYPTLLSVIANLFLQVTSGKSCQR